MTLTTVKRAARRRARGLPDGVKEPLRGVVVARRHHLQVEQIVSAGAFDQQWYEAQTGRTFDDVRDACKHYLKSGRKAGYSPHPLFEPAVVDTKHWRRSQTDQLVTNLRGRSSVNRPVHLALPVAWTALAGKYPKWLKWVTSAGPDTVMPTVGTAEGQAPVTWGEFRTRALELAAEQRRARDLVKAPRIVRHPPPSSPRLAAADIAPSTDGTPLVSIVLPTWNRGPMLRAAIESVQAQTLADWELVVVDDGSDDDTLLVLEGLRRRDPRITVIAAPHGGVCRARNIALDNARGRFIAFLDSDNTWNPEFLHDAAAFMLAENVRWAHAGMQLEREDGTHYRFLEGDHEHLLIANYIDLNVLFAQRSAIAEVGGFDETLRRAVDYDLVLRLAALSPPRLIPAIGAIYADSDEDDTRISVVEPIAWDQVVRVRHMVDRVRAAERPTVPGRISVVLPLRGFMNELVEVIDGLLDEPGDVEVVLVATGARDSLVRMVELLALSRPKLSVVTWPAPNLDIAASVDLGATRASGEFLTIWTAGHLPVAGWSGPLVEALQRPGVAMAQPLVLGHDGTVSSAGAVFVGTDPNPTPLLSGFPLEDSLALGTSEVPAALSGVVMLRAAHFWHLGGLDPLYGNAFAELDLSLRAQDDGLGSSVVVTEAPIMRRDDSYGFRADIAASVAVLRGRRGAPGGSTALWAKVGFEEVGRRTVVLDTADKDAPEVRGAEPVVRPSISVAEAPSRLRWAIDIAAPAGERGNGWGDLHFAEALARSLRALGQQVHVDRREARDGAHRDFDDVTLVLRGLDTVEPVPGDVSMLWVISHPDLVTGKEAAAYDRVFAASSTWAGQMSERWGFPLRPLLQCTDAAMFTPDAAAPDSADEVVFVGNSRGVYRPSLKHAVEAGLEPAVYGLGWRSLVPEELVRGEYLPNAALPALYASAGVVLNDHWDDMRHDGFISNRVFDVLASGGRLVSDDVPGLEELFGPAVLRFHSQHDFARLFTGDWRARFPDRESRLRTAALVRAEHTFDSRAATLIEAAMHLRADRGQGVHPGHVGTS